LNQSFLSTFGYYLLKAKAYLDRPLITHLE
jgi:hypothetical protein